MQFYSAYELDDKYGIYVVDPAEDGWSSQCAS